MSPTDPWCFGLMTAVLLGTALTACYLPALRADAAARVWAAVESKAGIGLVPAHGLTTIHYLVARELGAGEARRVVETLLGIFQVAPVDEAVLREALALPFGDFEDAVCAACAMAARCGALVTRDV